MTRGRAATPDPFDLSAVNTSDELFDALSARRLDDHAETDDPAAALLTALVADVDAGAPPLPAAAHVGCAPGKRRPPRYACGRHRLGVAALVLTVGRSRRGRGRATASVPWAPPTFRPRPRGTERSNENLQRQDPIAVTGSYRPSGGPCGARPTSGRSTGPRPTRRRRRDDADPRGAAVLGTTGAPVRPGIRRAHPRTCGTVRDPRSSCDDRHEPVPRPEYAPVTP